jgi:hypothetical protein
LYQPASLGAAGARHGSLIGAGFDDLNAAEMREQDAAGASGGIELVQTLGYTGDKG